MTIRNELIYEFASRPGPGACDPSGRLGELKKALLNRLMAAQFDHHLTQDRASGEGRNHCNSSTRRRVLTDNGTVELAIPRDREAPLRSGADR